MLLPLRQEWVRQTETVQAMGKRAIDVDPLLHYLGCEHSSSVLISSLEESLEDVGLRVDDQ